MRFKIAAIVLATLAGANAGATVVVDNSPDATGLTPDFIASNNATNQNFLASFTLGSATTLTGAGIYSSCRTRNCGAPNLGTAVIIKFRADVAGVPDTADLFNFSSTVSAIDSSGSTADPAIERVFAAFAPTTLAAGTYWFGLSGDDIEIGWSLTFNQPVGGLWQLSGDALQFAPDAVAPFQLESTVPEPATWALMIGGFAMVGAAMRRRTALAA